MNARPPRHHHHRPNGYHQKGAVVVVVLVMMLLAVLTALGTSRSQWLSERTVGSETDLQRAFAAAEAVLRDAELDIRGLKADGTTPCNAESELVGCRTSGSSAPYFPYTLGDYEIVSTMVPSSGVPCIAGICTPSDPQVMSIAYLKTNVTALTGSSVAARYGQFTGAVPGAASSPLLSSATPKAWYWIEVYRFNQSGFLSTGASGLPPPSRKSPFLYRITVHVQGLRSGTRVWLRSTLILKDAV